MIKWELIHPNATLDHLGFIPMFILENDPRPAKEQINERYAHGGGWHSFTGFKLSVDKTRLTYPGDPDMVLIARAQLRDETLLFFDCSWFCIVQPDGSYEISRLD